MSKFERIRRPLRTAAIAVCAALAVGACAEAGPTPETHGFTRCFDTPLPSNTPSRQPGSPPKLSFSVTDGRVKGDPILTPEIQTKLEDANVTVSDGKYNMSGFTTTAPDGSQVIITAAHGLASSKLDKFTVSNKKGEEAKVAKGCYVFESDGVYGDLFAENDKMEKTDFAILRLTQPLGSTALRLADKRPERGDWVTFVNSKGAYTVQNPARYNGIVAATTPTNVVDWQALTGVQPWRKSITGERSYIAEDGASGGMVVNPNSAEVVGISIHGGRGHYGAEATAGIFGINFDIPVGSSTGLLPTTAGIVGADVITHTLATSTSY